MSRLGEESGVAVTGRVGAGVGGSGVIICPAGAQFGEALEFVTGEPQGGGAGVDHGGGGGGLFDGGGGGGGMMRKLLPGGGGLPSGGSLWIRRNLCDERRVLGDSLVISSCDERRGGEVPLISSSSSSPLIKLL